ncbi:hypothetical protein CPB97_004066 [Podila verticillata]|nr:hypothetical protein CPB97_004066 [Podila verticillata]
MSDSKYTVREATEADVNAINAIVNYEVDHSVNNFNYSSRSEEDALVWFRSTINGGYPILVAVDPETDFIAGYACLGSFRQKDGYRFTAEYSLYIHQDHRRRGLGRLLLRDLLIKAKELKFHAIIGSISEGNEGSLKLCADFGFRVVGTMRENGYKFDRWIDNTFVELIL